MKMNKKLRCLLKKPAAQKILQELWDKRNDKKILIYLATTQDCINRYVEKGHPHGWLPENIMDICYGKLDGPLFNELKNASVIKEFSFGEGNFPDESEEYEYEGALVKGLDKERLKILRNWIDQLPYVLDHGDFSLNTLSGIAYYKDKETKLYKKAAYFKLLKSFLEQKNNKLSINEILKIKGSEEKIDSKEEEKLECADELIKNFGRRMGIRKGLNQIFPYTGDFFVLIG